MNSYIFGARSIAIGTARALRKLKIVEGLSGFLVSSLQNNFHEIDGLTVYELEQLSGGVSAAEKQNTQIFIATPEDIHGEITALLTQAGFSHLIPITSKVEAALMERYFQGIGLFPSLHLLPADTEQAKLSVFAARFYGDRQLKSVPPFPDYVHSISLGCDVNPEASKKVQTEFYDNTGENISIKNPNYCEMTAYYWIWKNLPDISADYVGLFHYRRKLDLSEDDLRRFKANDVDVVLPFPMLHLPDTKEHHTRYIKPSDWAAVLEALRDVHPDWMERFEEVFSQPYFYNYNLLIAKKQVFADYCQWLFPVLLRVEELTQRTHGNRRDRYIGYISESLSTLYFMSYQNVLNIYHTGRLLYI